MTTMTTWTTRTTTAMMPISTMVTMTAMAVMMTVKGFVVVVVVVDPPCLAPMRCLAPSLGDRSPPHRLGLAQSDGAVAGGRGSQQLRPEGPWTNAEKYL